VSRYRNLLTKDTTSIYEILHASDSTNRSFNSDHAKDDLKSFKGLYFFLAESIQFRRGRSTFRL